MANIADAFAHLSGDTLVDSVIYAGLPLWTSETPAQGLTVTYGFMATPALPADSTDTIANFEPFNATQQASVRLIYATAEPLTGLTFQETANTAGADILFGTEDIADPNTMAVTYFGLDASVDGSGNVSSLNRTNYVYLDNTEFADVNSNPLPGTLGYETVLHEIGHTLGLDDTAYTQILPSALDNTDFTVMSYNETDTYKTTFSVLDMAALQYIYKDSGTIRDFGVIPVPSWPGLTTAPTTGSTLAAA